MRRVAFVYRLTAYPHHVVANIIRNIGGDHRATYKRMSRLIVSRSDSYCPNLALVHCRRTKATTFVRIAWILLTIETGRVRVASYSRALPTSWRQFGRYVDPLAVSFIQSSERSVGAQIDVLTRFRVDGEVALIDVPDTGFFHWLVQFVPVCIYLAQSANVSTFVLADSTRKSHYLRETLELFANVEYRPEVVFSTRFERLSWDSQEFWAKELPRTEVYPNAWHVQSLASLRDELVSGLAAPRLSDLCRRLDIPEGCEALLSTGRGRILIHRAKSAQGRVLANDAECMQWANRHRILMIDLARLSVAEQIVLLARTHVLIGVHGAGLSNMVWMSSEIGGKVVELMPNDEVKWHFASMAKSLGLHYEAFPVRTATSGDFGRPESVCVDLEELSRVVFSETLVG